MDSLLLLPLNGLSIRMPSRTASFLGTISHLVCKQTCCANVEQYASEHVFGQVGAASGAHNHATAGREWL
eukprot:1892888-Lingulodinium_polyedra.AAC.1